MNTTYEDPAPPRTVAAIEADVSACDAAIADAAKRAAEGDQGALVEMQRKTREKANLVASIPESKLYWSARAAYELEREKVGWREEIESLKKKIEARRPAEVRAGEKWARAHLESEAAEREIRTAVEETGALLHRMHFLESKLSGKPLVYNRAMDGEFRISLIKEREFRRISGRSSFGNIFPANYFDPPAPKPTPKTASKGKAK